MSKKIQLIDVSFLKPLELVFQGHFENLESMILKDGYMQKPIIADKNTGTVLDGSHRYAFLLKHGYLTAPVQLVDYKSDDIRLGTKLKHRFLVDEEISLTKAECIKRASTGDLLKPRTTRHFFSFRKKDFVVQLSDLKKGVSRNVDFLIFEPSISYELEHNIGYLKEIDDEVEFIISYLAELNETKSYINKQVSLIKENKKIAFFPGKFHPPHLGHLKTILKLAPLYRTLIIGVSGDLPNDPMISQQEIYRTLKEFFERYENVDVTMFAGRLIDKKDTDGLPFFDTVLSGNPEVLTWASQLGLEATHVERSLGELSSTYIRQSGR